MPGNILVIDDNHLTAELLTRKLERLGHEVTLSSDVTEGIAQIKTNYFNLIFSEFVFENGDSLENFLLEIENIDTSKNFSTPIVITSNSVDDVLGETLMESSSNIFGVEMRPLREDGIIEEYCRLLDDESSSFQWSEFKDELTVLSSGGVEELEKLRAGEVAAADVGSMAPISKKEESEVREEVKSETPPAKEVSPVPQKVEEEEEVVDEKYLDPNFVADSGVTSLMYWAQKGDLAHVHELLKKGANYSTKCKKGKSILHYAARAKSRDVMEFFLNLGQKVTLTDSNRNDPLYEAVRYDRSENADLLIKLGANVNRQFSEGNFLILSILHGNENVFKLLLKKGVSPSKKDSNGNDAYYHAKRKKRMAMFKVMKMFEKGSK